MVFSSSSASSTNHCLNSVSAIAKGLVLAVEQICIEAESTEAMACCSGGWKGI